MQPPIKLIAVDMDGTLLDKQHQIRPRNKTVLSEARALGVEVIVATGRPRSAGAVRVIEELELTTPGIFLQGLAIYNADGSVRYQHSFDPELARPIIKVCESAGYAIMGQAGVRLIVAERSEHTDWIIGYGESAPEEFGSLLNILDDIPVNKWILSTDPERLEAMRRHLAEVVNGHAQIVQTLPHAIEILPGGHSKGTALRLLAEEMGIPQAQIMALGDGENDVEMLQYAGIGVAMGNAFPRCKEAADHVTATNEEDGVALAVERFVLGR